MEKNNLDKNSVLVSGHVRDFKYGFTCGNLKFYKCTLDLKRISGTVDEIPVVIPESKLTPDFNYEGKFVEIKGEYRSVNKNGKLILHVFSDELSVCDFGEWDNNFIELSGHICRISDLRKTIKTERNIVDFILAVNRRYGKSCYIPCIAWGKDAKNLSELPLGTEVELTGRIQSREYNKKISDGKYEIRTAYEVSVKEIKEVKRDD